jgi:hypothetical protein
MTCPTVQTHRWKLRDDGRSFVCVLCDEQRFELTSLSTVLCINCRASTRVGYRFGPMTPPGARRMEVGPFCEACHRLVNAHRKGK